MPTSSHSYCRTQRSVVAWGRNYEIGGNLNGDIMRTAAVMAEAFTIEEKRVEAKKGEAEEMS